MTIVDPVLSIPQISESRNSNDQLHGQQSRVTFVFVIASGPRNVKIGYSIDPERRLAQLQTGHERRLSLIHKEPVSDQQAPLIEKRIHHANRIKCLHGEWFDLTHEEAIREVEFAVIRYADNDDVGTEKTAARASTYPNSGTIHRLSDRELSEAIFLLLCSLSERMTGQVPALVGDGYDRMPNIICAADGPVVWLDPPDPAARRDSHPDK